MAAEVACVYGGSVACDGGVALVSVKNQCYPLRCVNSHSHGSRSSMVYGGMGPVIIVVA